MTIHLDATYYSTLAPIPKVTKQLHLVPEDDPSSKKSSWSHVFYNSSSSLSCLSSPSKASSVRTSMPQVQLDHKCCLCVKRYVHNLLTLFLSHWSKHFPDIPLSLSPRRTSTVHHNTQLQHNDLLPASAVNQA